MVLPRFVQQHFEGGMLCSARLFHMDMFAVPCRKQGVLGEVYFFRFDGDSFNFRITQDGIHAQFRIAGKIRHARRKLFFLLLRHGVANHLENFLLLGQAMPNGVAMAILAGADLGNFDLFHGTFLQSNCTATGKSASHTRR